MESRPQHQELQVLLFANSVWVLLRPTELWDRAYGLSSLSEKTTESNQMSLKKQHFLLSYLKTLIVGLTGILNPQPPA